MKKTELMKRYEDAKKMWRGNYRNFSCYPYADRRAGNNYEPEY